MKKVILTVGIILLALGSIAQTKQGSGGCDPVTESEYKWVEEVTEASTAVSGMKKLSQDNLDIRGAPTVSSDGSFIVFSGKEKMEETATNYYHLWKVSKVGGSLSKITGEQVSDYLPCLTPDSTHIIFTSARRGTNYELWKTSVRGIGGLTKLFGTGMHNDLYPDISPDGSKILFVNQRVYGYETKKENTMWMMNINGSDLTQLRPGTAPRWAPDGEKIIFEYEDNIWVMNQDGSEVTKLTNDNKSHAPYWSPDGKKICYHSDQTGNFDIWMIGADGATQLTQNLSADLNPVWASDGLIYFITNRGTGIFTLWSMKPIGYTSQPLPKKKAETSQPPQKPAPDKEEE